MDLNGQNIMILGDGLSGKAAYNATKDIAFPFFYNESFDFSRHKKPDLIVTSPGIETHPAFDYAKRFSIKCISELELGYLLNKSSVIAITGTNGKTTVTSLIADILKTQYDTQVCGNIGIPFCSVVNKSHQLAIVEVSSFQLERTFLFNPSIAVITNITPDHLNRHKTMQAYNDLKLKIASNQTEDDILICPIELKPLLKNIKSNIIFSDVDCTIKNQEIYFMNQPVMPLSDIKLKGEHNIQNVMQAICVAKLVDIDNKNIRDSVINYRPQSHRIEFVCNKNGKDWYDDSKSTNVDSCIAACKSMSGTTALILGGSDKGECFDELFVALPKNINHIYVMGETKQKLIDSANKANLVVCQCKDLQEALHSINKLDVKNVLLSPAAASFDSYKDYRHRGEEYQRLIKQL